MSNSEVIRLASNLSCVVPLAIYATRFYGADKTVHIISALMVVSGVADLITYATPYSSTSILIYNIQDLLQFSIVCAFFFCAGLDRKFLSWGVTIYITGLVAVTLWHQGFHQNQTLLWALTGVIILTFATKFLIDVFGAQQKTDSITNVWINAGLLFYFCFSMYLFAMGDYILNELPERARMVYWSCHNINNILKNVFIAIGIGYSKSRLNL